MNASGKILIALFSLFLFHGCYENEPVPTAAFTFSGSNDFVVPCEVTFTNHSTEAHAYLWNFGNDSTSTDTNPAYPYTIPGKYRIELRAYTESRNEWASARAVLVVRE